MKRSASAIWQGSLKEGSGKISTQSKTLDDTQYSFKTRFEEGVGTNPEELVAAAHAGCFTMQLTAFLSEEKYDVDFIDTKCEIDLQDGTIVSSHLTLTAKIANISEEDFQKLVTKAEENCPISKLFNAKITSQATLV